MGKQSLSASFKLFLVNGSIRKLTGSDGKRPYAVVNGSDPLVTVAAFLNGEFAETVINLLTTHAKTVWTKLLSME